MIVAGPNGSGKSTAFKNTSIETLGQSVWLINPDLLAVRIQVVEHLSLAEANLEAVKRIEAWLESSIRAHQTVGVETVLSTDKYRRLVTLAKTLKFEIRFIYVILDSPEHNVQRVKLRVRQGGHTVPEAKIVDRYNKSLQQMPWFLEQSDEAWIYDNSASEPRLIGEKRDGVITLDEDALQSVVEAVKTIQTE